MKALLSVVVVLMLAMVVAGSAYAQTPTPAPNFTYSGPPPPATYVFWIVSGQMSVTAWDGTLTGKIQQQCHIEPDWIGGIAATGFICDATFSADFSATWDSVNLKFVGTASYQFEAKGGGTLTPSYTPLVSIIQIERSGSGQLKAEFTPAALEQWPYIFAIGGKPPVGVIFYDQNESDRLTTNGTRIDVSQNPPTTITCDTVSCYGPAMDWIIQVSPLINPELTIQGPSRVYPGVPAKFTALLNGAPVNAIWTCSPDRGVIDANGVFTASSDIMENTTATISAAYSNLSAAVTVQVSVLGNWFQGNKDWAEFDLGFRRPGKTGACEFTNYKNSACKLLTLTWLLNAMGWNFSDPTELEAELLEFGEEEEGEGSCSGYSVSNGIFKGAFLADSPLQAYLRKRFTDGTAPAGANGLHYVTRLKNLLGTDPGNNPEWSKIFDNLEQGIPVPLLVKYADKSNAALTHEHWVLAIGTDADGEIIIRDPNNRIQPVGTLSGGYNGSAKIQPDPNNPSIFYQAAEAVIYKREAPGSKSNQWITFDGLSPIQMVITDPRGRRFGVDIQTGTLVNELTNASYLVEAFDDVEETSTGFDIGYEPAELNNLGIKSANVSQPIPGEYKIEAFGLADGPYQVIVRWYDCSDQEVVTTFEGMASVGSKDTYEFEFTGVQFFEDVPCDFWAANQIAAVYGQDIVRGYEDGTYQPNNPVTRDQMAVYIARAIAGGEANVPDPGCSTPPFTDVACDHWARKYIQLCVNESIVQGYEDGTYQPSVGVTRDQMAVYTARSIASPRGEAGLAGYTPADPRNFPDVASTFWAYKHIEYCVENSVVNGYGDGLYHPEIVVTRDQMAVYVARAFGLL